MKEKVTNFIKKNSKIILTLVIAFAELIIISREKNIFNYWNLDFTFYKFEIIKELSALFLQVIQLIIDIAFMLLLYTIYDKSDKPKFCFKTLHRYVVFFLKHGGICAVLSCTLSVINLFFNFSFSLCLEMLIYIVAKFIIYLLIILFYQKTFNTIKNDFQMAKKKKKEGKLMVTVDLTVIILVSTIMLTCSPSETYLKTNFKIINNNQVLLYNTVDYAIVAKCEIEEEKIIIYTNSQEKLSSDNLKTYSKTFNKVIKRDN